MNLLDSIQTALRAVSANKLRSFITMLGVVIGVGSVIAMIGICGFITWALPSRIDRVAARPSRCGMRTSISTRS